MRRNRRVDASYLRAYITPAIADVLSRLLVENAIEALDTTSEIMVTQASRCTIFSLTQDAPTGAAQLIACACKRAMRRVIPRRPR